MLNPEKKSRDFIIIFSNVPPRSRNHLITGENPAILISFEYIIPSWSKEEISSLLFPALNPSVDRISTLREPIKTPKCLSSKLSQRFLSSTKRMERRYTPIFRCTCTPLILVSPICRAEISASFINSLMNST
jgi:hypothetical protein